jgi:hypothetical protein
MKTRNVHGEAKYQVPEGAKVCMDHATKSRLLVDYDAIYPIYPRLLI